MENQISLVKKTTLFSFIIGTTIFVIYYLTSMWQLLFIGYAYIIITLIVNVVVYTSTILLAIKDSENRKKLLNTSMLLFLNIPVLLIYISFSIFLINKMRITFKNTTENELSEINIIGCESKYISKLKPSESKTVWVKITGDCSINIEYIKNGKKEKEIVAGYLTDGMGQKINHKIGVENQLKF